MLLFKPNTLTLFNTIQSIAPGVGLCASIAVIGMLASMYLGVPTMIICLLLGIALHTTFDKGYAARGIEFTAKTILRFGVVLIGARITFSDFMFFGPKALALVVIASIAIIFISILCARLLKLDNELGILGGVATAICGASAAVAISALMPSSKTLEQNTIMTIIGVTMMGTIAMITYPFLMNVLPLNSEQAGIIIGGTIHDVAQVVGAGYSVSTETGDAALLIKMMRVALLIPILAVFAFTFARTNKDQDKKKPPFPFFLIGFFTLMTLNSMKILPDIFMHTAELSCKWLLIAAIAAIGLKTSLPNLLSLGPKPLYLFAINTITITAIYMLVVSMGWV